MSRICRSPSPDSRSLCLRMSKCFALLLLLLAPLLPGYVLAEQSGIQIVESSHRTEFAAEIAFDLVAASDAPIDRVAIYRQLVGQVVRARSEIDVQPAKRVEANFVWELEPGELKLGSEISYSWVIENVTGESITTEPIVFSYTDDRFQWQRILREEIHVEFYGSDRGRAEEILAAAWEAAQRLKQDTGVVLEKPITIYVYANQADMRAALSSRGSVYDERTTTLGVAAGDDTLILLGSHSDVIQTVAHEMSHIVVGLATDNPYTDLPRWLDEGLAMYAEGALPRDNERALQRAVGRDQLISIRSLSAYVGDPDQVDLFYGEVYSLVAFMLDSYGKDRMADLLGVFRTGILAEDAVQQVYGFGLDQLDAEWRVSLGLRPRGETSVDERSSQRDDEREPFCFGPFGAMVGATLGLAALARKQ